jgi:hypothetical protein
MWPKGFRKKKPYTAEELLRCKCELDAERIRRALGQGEIIHLAPPDEHVMCLGAVYPPGGGVVTEWRYHRAVRIDQQIYDRMTGPEGMPQEQYLHLFADRDVLVIRPVGGEA